jgi:hypothetical protein
LNRSLLAVMTVNNDPLSVEFCLFRFRRQKSEGRSFGFASTPNWLSPSGRNEIVDPIIVGCPELIVVSVQKVARRGKQATESDGPKREKLHLNTRINLCTAQRSKMLAFLAKLGRWELLWETSVDTCPFFFYRPLQKKLDHRANRPTLFSRSCAKLLRQLLRN